MEPQLDQQFHWPKIIGVTFKWGGYALLTSSFNLIVVVEYLSSLFCISNGSVLHLLRLLLKLLKSYR